MGTTGQPSRSGRSDGAIIENPVPTTRNNVGGGAVFAILLGIDPPDAGAILKKGVENDSVKRQVVFGKY